MGFTHSYDKASLNEGPDNWSFGYETGRIARSIALGQGFSSPFIEPSGPTAWLAPSYPYLLAGVFKIFGIYTLTSAVVILSMNCLFSASTCGAIFLVGRTVFGPDVGAWGAWAWAFFPPAIFFPTTWIWETSLSALLFSVLLLLAVCLDKSNSLGLCLGFGLAWGFAALTNVALLSIMPLWFIWLWVSWTKRNVNYLWSASLALGAFAVMTSPWIIRNYLILNRSLLFRSDFGVELRVGNPPELAARVDWSQHPTHNSAEMARFRQNGEVAFAREKEQEAVFTILHHKLIFVRRTAKRAIEFWTDVWGLRSVTDIVSGIFLMCTCGFAAWGLYTLALQNSSRGWLFAIPLIVFPLVYYITAAYGRYRHPIDPELVLLASFGACTAFRKKNSYAVRDSPEQSQA